MITGIAVTSGPWLMTTALLVLMRLMAVAAGVETVTNTERVITIVYALVIVLAAPIDIVLTRYSADMVYERRRERIVAPLRRVLAAGTVVFGSAGGLAMLAVTSDLQTKVAGIVLAALVGAQWLLVSAAGGLSSPGIILKAFAVGPVVSVMSWLPLAAFDVGPTAYLYGFIVGQAVTLGLLLWGTLVALPAEEDEDAEIGPAVREYAVMALAAFSFNAGLWSDKLVVLLQHGGAIVSQYAALAALAWLTVIPACGYLFVNVETTFHERFQSFYESLRRGASLPQLEVLAARLRDEVHHTLLGTFAVQISTTLLCLAAAPIVVRALRLTGAPSATIYWLLIGVALQVVAVSSILLLYYFDFRREALISAMTQLVTNTVFTGLMRDTLAAGYTAACFLTSVVSLTLLLRSLPGLLPRTFRTQVDLLEAAGNS